MSDVENDHQPGDLDELRDIFNQSADADEGFLRIRDCGFAIADDYWKDEVTKLGEYEATIKDLKEQVADLEVELQRNAIYDKDRKARLRIIALREAVKRVNELGDKSIAINLANNFYEWLTNE